MNLRSLLYSVVLLFATAGLAQEKTQPLPKDPSKLPSLNRTFQQGMKGLEDRFKMKKRTPLTAGIDNWYAVDEAQHIVLSLIDPRIIE